MRYVYRVLEIITLMVWFGCIMASLGGVDLRLVAGLLLCISGLWVVVAALAAYQDKKAKSNSKSNSNGRL